MNYDESVSLERKAIFRYLPINETIVVLSSRIWERVVPLPGKIDSPGLDITNCQNGKRGLAMVSR